SENRAAVFAAWRLHADDVRHSLVNGFYQGWDLHPAQLVPRYGSVYAFFLAGLAPASEPLKHFVDNAAQATLVGDLLDDAATRVRGCASKSARSTRPNGRRGKTWTRSTSRFSTTTTTGPTSRLARRRRLV